MSDERIKEILCEMSRSEEIPSFEETWRGAMARSEKREKTALRWLVPSLGFTVAAAAAVVLLAVVPSGGDPADKEELAALMDLEIPDAGTLPLNAEGALFASREDERAELGLDLGLFEGETDFLLEMNSPAWSEEKGRRL